jgi:hypothetical protein
VLQQPQQVPALTLALAMRLVPLLVRQALAVWAGWRQQLQPVAWPGWQVQEAALAAWQQKLQAPMEKAEVVALPQLCWTVLAVAAWQLCVDAPAVAEGATWQRVLQATAALLAGACLQQLRAAMEVASAVIQQQLLAAAVAAQRSVAAMGMASTARVEATMVATVGHSRCVCSGVSLLTACQAQRLRASWSCPSRGQGWLPADVPGRLLVGSLLSVSLLPAGPPVTIATVSLWWECLHAVLCQNRYQPLSTLVCDSQLNQGDNRTTGSA